MRLPGIPYCISHSGTRTQGDGISAPLSGTWLVGHMNRSRLTSLNILIALPEVDWSVIYLQCCNRRRIALSPNSNTIMLSRIPNVLSSRRSRSASRSVVLLSPKNSSMFRPTDVGKDPRQGGGIQFTPISVATWSFVPPVLCWCWASLSYFASRHSASRSGFRGSNTPVTASRLRSIGKLARMLGSMPLVP
jgi:hypothetical protein